MLQNIENDQLRLRTLGRSRQPGGAMREEQFQLSKYGGRLSRPNFLGFVIWFGPLSKTRGQIHCDQIFDQSDHYQRFRFDLPSDHDVIYANQLQSAVYRVICMRRYAADSQRYHRLI
jgi:hypothetical protein